MSLLRFKVFQPIFFKTATFFSIWVSAFLYAGNAYSADVTLAWDGVSQSGVSVTGYRVYYGTQNGPYPTRGCQVTGTSCTVKELKDGQTYHFVARAYNSYGESGDSDPVSYTVPNTLQTFTIEASVGSDGSIDPSGTVNVIEGQSKTFSISAHSGFHIDAVLVDGVSQGAIATYTFTDVARNHLITASFKEVSADAPVDGNPSDSTSDSGSSGSSAGSGSTEPTGGTSPSSGSSNTSSSNGATTDNNSVVSPAVTPAQEFVNQAPDQPGLLYPVDGAQEVSLTPLLEIVGFTDPDADDDHGATRWQIAEDDSFELPILDVTIDRSRTNNHLVNLLVPHGTLCSEQLYYWRASVKDARDGDPNWSNWSETFTFTTAAKVQADVNANAVADDEEPEYSDLDNDGRNDNDQPLMRVYRSRRGQSLIGINAVEGVSQINCFTSVEPESILDEPRPKLRYGLMVFNVTLDQIGGTARFELYVPEKPRIEAKWYKYDPINGWYKFPVDNDGEKYYVEITDGGFGDADGVENGIIVDPIGLADMSNEVESVDALDAVDSGDSESTMDRLKNACFIQVALDRSAVETTDVGTRQMVAFRFIYCGFMALVLAVAVIQVMGGRRGNRTHASHRSNGRSRSA